jgi:hypothetical protein
MTETVEPKLQFCSLPEEAVVAALDDADPANPIAVEIARLMTAYTNNFRRHAERLEHIPAEILRMKPRWPIEAVAMRLTTQALRDSVAQPESLDSTN